ncbi:hypothetical protein T10_12679 [Trichinella papuae]|uniref:Uncharacterized protein n=1 Tax=Trichinella papuae TaxID=268474 RepID=A0A0V1MJJ7_9BILA|nr:hypothetical protein T10_12679 [Trichinella papuae]
MKEKQDRQRERRRKAEKLNAEMHLGRRHQPPQFIYKTRSVDVDRQKVRHFFIGADDDADDCMIIIIIMVLEEDRGIGGIGRALQYHDSMTPIQLQWQLVIQVKMPFVKIAKCNLFIRGKQSRYKSRPMTTFLRRHFALRRSETTPSRLGQQEHTIVISTMEQQRCPSRECPKLKCQRVGDNLGAFHQPWSKFFYSFCHWTFVVGFRDGLDLYVTPAIEAFSPPRLGHLNNNYSTLLNGKFATYCLVINEQNS